MDLPSIDEEEGARERERQRWKAATCGLQEGPLCDKVLDLLGNTSMSADEIRKQIAFDGQSKTLN